MVLIYRKNGLSYNRRAFLASKKVGRSVQRNRARRLLRESFRSIENQLEPGYDLLFIARNTIVNLKYADVKKSMEAAIKAKLLKAKSGEESEKDSYNLGERISEIYFTTFPKPADFIPAVLRFYSSSRKYGALKGSYLGIKRILKCHPFHPGGYDPLK